MFNFLILSYFLWKLSLQSRIGFRTFNASCMQLSSTVIYGFQSLANVSKHKELHFRYRRTYFLLSVLYINIVFRKHLYHTNLNVWLNVNAPYIYPINLFHISWNTKCEPKIYIPRKTLLVANLVSRHVNLSVHHQCAIQNSLRINTQPQLQSSASHHTLVSRCKLLTIYQTPTSKRISFP